MNPYIPISNFLNKVLIDKPFFFFNLWSIVHFCSGFVVMFFVLKLFKVSKFKKFLILFLLLVIYEIFEVTLLLMGSNMFRIETRLDIFLDLVIGMLGGLLSFFIFRKN